MHAWCSGWTWEIWTCSHPVDYQPCFSFLGHPLLGTITIALINFFSSYVWLTTQHEILFLHYIVHDHTDIKTAVLAQSVVPHFLLIPTYSISGESSLLPLISHPDTQFRYMVVLLLLMNLVCKLSLFRISSLIAHSIKIDYIVKIQHTIFAQFVPQGTCPETRIKLNKFKNPLNNAALLNYSKVR